MTQPILNLDDANLPRMIKRDGDAAYNWFSLAPILAADGQPSHLYVRVRLDGGLLVIDNKPQVLRSDGAKISFRLDRPVKAQLIGNKIITVLYTPAGQLLTLPHIQDCPTVIALASLDVRLNQRPVTLVFEMRGVTDEGYRIEPRLPSYGSSFNGNAPTSLQHH